MRKVCTLLWIFGWTSTQQVVDAAGSVGSMESFDNENDDKRTQQARYCILLSFITVNISRCCPLRCRGRLLRLLRCSTTRTIKLSTLERSVLFLRNLQATKSSSVCKENISKVGTIVRSLGHCPSESQLQEVKYILHLKINACPMSFQAILNFWWLARWRTLSRWVTSTWIASFPSCRG